MKNEAEVPIVALVYSDGNYVEITQEKPRPKDAFAFPIHSPLFNVRAEVLIGETLYEYPEGDEYGFEEFGQEIYEEAEKNGETDFYLRLRCVPAYNEGSRSDFLMRDLRYTATIADKSVKDFIGVDEDAEYMVTRIRNFVYDEEKYVPDDITAWLYFEAKIQNISGAVFKNGGGFSTAFAEYLE